MISYFQGKTIWITGASSGIGKALAHGLARYNCRLILSARRTDELLQVAVQCRSFGSEVLIYPFDLANPLEVDEVADKIIHDLGVVDILVNNGGITQRSLIIETPIEIDRRIMEVDYFSGVALAKKLLTSMVQRKSGHIVVIGSVTGIFGFPQRSAYSAAKHAIQGFYQTLWAELHQLGIHVTIVNPGRIRTNISCSALTKSGEPYGIMDHGAKEGRSAEQCALKIIKADSKRKIEVYIAGKEMFLVYFKRYIPWLFYKLIWRVKI